LPGWTRLRNMWINRKLTLIAFVGKTDNLTASLKSSPNSALQIGLLPV
jgi:hypothetical protein